MSSPGDNLLSAYHDGELTAAERLVVEQRLASSAAARHELSQIGQISVLLQEMPRLTLLTEFPQQVLQGIEREMLIPSERSHDVLTGVNLVDPAISSVSRFSRANSSPRRWLVGAAAVLASAAGLLLMVVTFGDRSAKLPADTRQVAGEVGLPQSFGAIAATTDRMTIEVAETTHLGKTASPLSATPAVADADSNAVGLGGGAVTAMKELNSRLPIAAFNSPRGADSLANLFLDQATLKSAEIGDVIDALQTLDDEIAVVRLTVVDRQQGLDQLQLLFAKNQIDVATSADKKSNAISSKPVASSKRDAVAGAEQLMAVYVESDSQHLTQALQELSQNKLVQSFEVESPISLAELNPPNEKMDDQSSAKSKAEKPPAGAFPPSVETVNRLKSQRVFAETLNQARQFPVAREERASLVQDRKSGDQTRRFAKKSLPNANAKDASPTQSASRQTTLQVPADALPQQNFQNSQSRARSNNANFGQRSQNQAKQNADAQNEQRPMQVLFVVVNQAVNAGEPTPSAAADTKPSVPAKSKAKVKDVKTPEDGGAA